MVQKFYRWFASSNDKSYEDESRFFASKEDCYNDMRNAVLEKMKWNTEFAEDFENENTNIIYSVDFTQNEIVHESYSGTYTYTIHEFEKWDERGNLTLYHEKLKGKGGKLTLVFSNGNYTNLYMTYGEGDYFPQTIYECLTCRWQSECYANYYYLTINSESEFQPRLLDEGDYERLVKLNPTLDGVCLVSMNSNEIFAISLQDIRKKGIKMAMTDSIQLFKEKEIHFGRKWDIIDELPTDRENLWKVLDCEEYTLWMDNEYGEMFLIFHEDEAVLRTNI